MITITEDYLRIAYDNDPNDEDRPLLLVMRVKEEGIEGTEIIKAFMDDEAVKIYKLLTEVNGEEK